MTEPKLYSIREANDLLVFLAPAMVELREKYERAARIKDRMDRAAVSNGGSEKKAEWTRVLARVDGLFDKLRSWEIEVKDIETGLVDFPTMMDGRPAYLCWRLGEESVRYWHFPEEGFAGRKPL